VEISSSKEKAAHGGFSRQADLQQKTEGSLETLHKYQRAK